MAKESAPDLGKFRNIGVIAHIDAGKTTTTEHLLYYSGAVHRLGSVDGGDTETDYDQEEQERGITIYSACVPFKWQGVTVNLIDTPGHVDFTAEVERSLRVLDGAVCVFDAQKGVEAQSETVWRQATKYGVPRLAFINKMDVVGANFANAMEEIRTRLEGEPVAINIPIGAGSVKDSAVPFRGIIDLIEQKALFFDQGDFGKTVRAEPIPDDLALTAQEYREKLFDMLTRHDDHDKITTAVLEGRDIPVATVRELIREQTIKGQIHPVLCGSGREHIGIQPLLDAVVWYLPTPLDRPAVEGKNPKKPDKVEKRKPELKESFCGLVFKVVADQHGELYYVRIYSGTVKANSRQYNPGKDIKENVTKLYHVHADPKRNREEIPTSHAGDIVAIQGLRDSITGDTLCETQHPILLETISFAEAVVSQSIEPETSADKDKLVATLNVLKKEDPTFTWRDDADTGQKLMFGMGKLHLEVKQHRMERDFKLKVRVGKPRVSYRETVKRERQETGEFARLIGGTHVEARVEVRLAPLKSQTHAEPIWDPALRDVVSPATVAAINQSIRGALESGMVGYPVIHVQPRVCGVVESKDAPAALNETAVQAAAADAVNRILRDNVLLLEPIMRVEVQVPDEYYGAITADLQAKRAEITKTEQRGKWWVVEALVPLARMFDYAEQARSLSQGRASSTMEPHSYREAPPDVLQGILNPI
ncbi:MAG: elongation factor G [Gemmataceae bacterium]